jgi:hypothetical protein
VKDPAVLAHEDRADADGRETRRSRRAGRAAVRIAAAASACRIAPIAPASKRGREGRARARVHVADFGDLLAPGEDRRHEGSRQSLRRMPSDDGPPAAAQDIEVDAIQVDRLGGRLDVRTVVGIGRPVRAGRFRGRRRSGRSKDRRSADGATRRAPIDWPLSDWPSSSCGDLAPRLAGRTSGAVFTDAAVPVAGGSPPRPGATPFVCIGLAAFRAIGQAAGWIDCVTR